MDCEEKTTSGRAFGARVHSGRGWFGWSAQKPRNNIEAHFREELSRRSGDCNRELKALAYELSLQHVTSCIPTG